MHKPRCKIPNNRFKFRCCADLEVAIIPVQAPVAPSRVSVVAAPVSDQLFNRGPIIVNSIPPVVGKVGRALGPIDMSRYFQDPDGDNLRYSLVGLVVGSGLKISAQGSDPFLYFVAVFFVSFRHTSTAPHLYLPIPLFHRCVVTFFGSAMLMWVLCLC